MCGCEGSVCVCVWGGGGGGGGGGKRSSGSQIVIICGAFSQGIPHTLFYFFQGIWLYAIVLNQSTKWIIMLVYYLVDASRS